MMQHSVVVGCQAAIYTQISGLILLWGRCSEFLKTQSRKDVNLGIDGDIDTLVAGYRHLQILERNHNSSYSARILPLCIATVPFLLVLSGYALVALFSTGSLAQMLTFLVVYLDITVFALVVLTAASGINVQTEEWVKKVKSGSGNRYLARVRKSWRPLRLEFGGNYVDRLTPLVIQEFCVRQTASLLLLTGA